MSQLIIPLPETVKEIKVPGLLKNADINGSRLTPNRQNSEGVACLSGGKYIEKLSTT